MVYTKSEFLYLTLHELTLASIDYKRRKKNYLLQKYVKTDLNRIKHEIMKMKILLFVFLLLSIAIIEFSGCKKEDAVQTVNMGSGTGIITALNCGTTTNIGTLTVGTAASGVSISIPYNGGNGGMYSGQTVTSTGVTGLTASLVAGTFATGAGNLIYTITGTPITAGTASFALNIGGQTCILNSAVNPGDSTASCGAINVHNPNLAYGSMTDQDGNTYKTTIIGNQEWMAENLKASHYRNGDLIPVVIYNLTWSGLSTGATCWYNNDSATYNCPYGKLYNWYTVADPRKVCPTGWHVPTDAEWTTLIDYLGGEPVAGGKMKSTGTQYWLSPNTDAVNSYGFSSLPGGLRKDGGPFRFNGDYGFWWSSTNDFGNLAWLRCLYYDYGFVTRFSDYKEMGLSIRCLRD